MTSRNGTVIQWNGDGKPSSIGNVAFVYDGVGTRLKKISGGETTKYLGGNYEIAADGTVTKYLIGGKKQGNKFFILHRDHLGSIQVVSNQFGWQVLQRKSTSPSGISMTWWEPPGVKGMDRRAGGGDGAGLSERSVLRPRDWEVYRTRRVRTLRSRVEPILLRLEQPLEPCRPIRPRPRRPATISLYP